MTTITRGQKLLDQITAAGAISASGRNWLIAAVDPFHDDQLNITGYPDVESGASVVRCIKQSMSVKTGGLVPWDCHVVAWPWLTQGTGLAGVGQFQTSSNRSGQVFEFSDGAPIAMIGGLQAFEVPTGDDLSVLTSLRIGQLKVDDEFTQGAGRLIGAGFEIHNTTADIYKQGACTSYRMMANDPTPCTMFGSSTTKKTAFSAVNVRYPPVNLAEAMLIPGTKQWEAAEGAYSVCALHTVENPARPQAATTPIFAAVANDDFDGVLNISQINFPRPAAILGASGQAPMVPFRVHPIHQNGVILSGLSPQTTLTINWNVYYESFPGPAEQSLLPLASPSAQFDPAVLTLYSRLMSELPIAVMVKENGLGDWFLHAAGEAAKFVAPLLIKSGNPLAVGAGALASYLGKTAESYVTPQSVLRPAGPRQTPGNPWETKSGLGRDRPKKPKKKTPARKPQIQPAKKA